MCFLSIRWSKHQNFIANKIQWGPQIDLLHIEERKKQKRNGSGTRYFQLMRGCWTWMTLMQAWYLSLPVVVFLQRHKTLHLFLNDDNNAPLKTPSQASCCGDVSTFIQHWIGWTKRKRFDDSELLKVNLKHRLAISTPVFSDGSFLPGANGVTRYETTRGSSVWLSRTWGAAVQKPNDRPHRGLK